MPQDAREVEAVRDRFLSIASDYGQLTLRRRWRARMVGLQLGIYCFLEKPRGFLAKFYHFAIFVLIALVCILSAVAEFSSSRLAPFVNFLEIFLSFYLLAEFLLRLWAVGVDAHFKGFRGRLAFLCRPISLIDLIVLLASFYFLFTSDNGNEGQNGGPRDGNEESQSIAFLHFGPSFGAVSAIEKLRFVQILRLLHIDRQMSAFQLIQRMIRRSLFELLSAYYITFMVFLALAVCVFTTEEWLEEWERARDGPGGEEGKTFRNFGDSFWFSIVTVLTIGYGDILPRGWLSKVAVCLLSYLGLSMFSTASGLVGVGISLMLSGEKQQRQQSKVRDLAARLIQSWVRFHLISDRERFARIRVYRKFCGKLQGVEEKIRKCREMVRMAGEKRKAERKQSRVLRMVQKYSPISERRPSPLAKSSAAQLQQEDQFEDFSDDERLLDFYYGQRSHSNSLLSNKSEETANNVPDESQNGRQRSILRMCYFLLFICLSKKFKRARKPYEFVDAEAELCELECQRVQKFKELEMRLDTQLGKKAARSALVEREGEGNSQGILERMELCERKVGQMERKAEFIEHLARLLVKGFHAQQPAHAREREPGNAAPHLPMRKMPFSSPN